MSYILIDVDNILVENNLKGILTRLPKIAPKQPEYRRGLVLGTSYDDIQRLNSIKNPNEKLQFLDNNLSVYSYTSLVCNGDLCEIHNLTDSGMIPFIINSVTPEATFWISVQSNDSAMINQLIAHGFTSPFTCRMSPFHNSVSDDTICLLKVPGNIISDFSKVMNDIDHIAYQQQSRSNTCNITAQFSSQTVEYLRKIPTQNGTEIAGAMQIIGNNRIGNKVVYMIEVNHNSIVKGENELVDVLNDKYNFHTHPQDAYIRNGVNHAWPSDHDYLGFLKAVFYSNSVFHVVVTIEGVYIISIAPEYAGNINELKSKQNYIAQVYQIPHNSFTTPQDYITHVNQLKIFSVVFFPWNEATTPFTVYYPKTNGGCSI